MLTHRTAQLSDAHLYFDWANDPYTRRQSFHSEPISLETHTTWFTRRLTDANTLMLVFDNEVGDAVGQVRFERKPVADMPNEVVISLSVDVHHRGQGLAHQLIEQGGKVCQSYWGDVTVHAYVKPDNQASARAFERAGFTLSGESGKFGPLSQQKPNLLYLKTL